MSIVRYYSSMFVDIEGVSQERFDAHCQESVHLHIHHYKELGIDLPSTNNKTLH
jgi:hypothetical protein